MPACAASTRRKRNARPAFGASFAAPTCRSISTPLLSLINFGKDDEPSLAVDKVRYKGEPIVAIVADSPREAFEALAKVRVDYEPLPAVFDVEEALKSGAPVVNETYPKNTFVYHDVYDHQKLRFGDVERGLAEADHVLEQRYQMSPIEHAPTETNGSIAAPDTNGRYVVYTSTQASVLLARHLRQDPRRALQHLPLHRRHRRRRLLAARWTRSPNRSPFSARC